MVFRRVAIVLYLYVANQIFGNGYSEPTFEMMLLDCDGSEAWAAFRRAHIDAGGQCTEQLFVTAVETWTNMDWEAAVHHLARHMTPSTPGVPEFRIRDNSFSADPHVKLWISLANVLVGHAISLGQDWIKATKEGIWLRGQSDIEYLDCPWDSASPYGLLMAQNVILKCSRQVGLEIPLDKVEQLRFFSTALLELPDHIFDFLESTSWNTSSFDIATTLIGCDSSHDAPLCASFGEYATLRPVPKAFLPSWMDDLDPALAWTTHSTAQAKVQDKLQIQLNAGSILTVTMLNLHDASSWDQWQSLLAAVKQWFPSVDEDTLLKRFIHPKWFFTRVHALTVCEEGSELKQGLVQGFDALRQQFDLAQQGKLDLAGFREWLHMIWYGHTEMREADILLCSEAFVLCPLLNAVARRPTIGRFDLALLNEWHFSAEDLVVWWVDFYELVERRDVFVSVASRATGEQVYEQTGIRFPYVPYLSLQLVRYRWDRGDASTNNEVLFFGNNRPGLLSFRDGLRLFFQASGQEYDSLRLRDMNSAGLCRPEMANFRASVLVPHVPNALRLYDLYALGVPTFVPGEPLIHKYVWNNRGFAGYASPDMLWRQNAPNDMRLLWRARTQRHRNDLPDNHPPFSSWEHLRDWTLHKHLDARRYWLQYLEWSSFPGLQRFVSFGDLLARLLVMETAAGRLEAAEIRMTMKRHHDALVVDALGWWRAAATMALQPRIPLP